MNVTTFTNACNVVGAGSLPRQRRRHCMQEHCVCFMLHSALLRLPVSSTFRPAHRKYCRMAYIHFSTTQHSLLLLITYDPSHHLLHFKLIMSWLEANASPCRSARVNRSTLDAVIALLRNIESINTARIQPPFLLFTYLENSSLESPFSLACSKSTRVTITGYCISGH